MLGLIDRFSSLLKVFCHFRMSSSFLITMASIVVVVVVVDGRCRCYAVFVF